MKSAKVALRASIALAAVTIVLGASPMAAHGQSQADRRAVLSTLDAFFRGMRTKDSTLMLANIDTLTRFTLLRPSPAGARVVVLRATDFIRAVMAPDQAAYDEPIRRPIVNIDADLATVWAEYQVRREGRVTHCGYDAFQLARLGGKWKILNVSDTYRTTGCGAAWPSTK